MLTRYPAVYAALFVALLVCAPQASNAQDDALLKDSSFEEQLPADEGGWSLFEESLFSDDQAHSGTNSMFNAALSRTVAYPPYFIGSVAGSFQELAAEAGSRWRLTGYGLTSAKLEGTPAFGVVQVTFFDAEGKDLGTVETADNTTLAKVSNQVNNQSPVGEWIFLDTGVATAPDGTAKVQAFTIYVDFSGSNVSQGVYFDDLNLCALSEDDASNSCD